MTALRLEEARAVARRSRDELARLQAKYGRNLIAMITLSESDRDVLRALLSGLESIEGSVLIAQASPVTLLRIIGQGMSDVTEMIQLVLDVSATVPDPPIA